MSIQISGTTVIDQNKYIQNIAAYYGPGVASQAEAEAGTNNDQLMTPLRVAQAIASAGGSVIKRIQRGSSSVYMAPYPPAPAPITTVDISKTMVINQQMCYGADSGAGSYTGRINNSHAAIIDPAGNKLNFTTLKPSPGSNNGSAYWQVIEFN